MAERRMFSVKVIESARFLKMPPSTQNLYFHLGLKADDDGVVEAYTVIRSVGSTEDDLKLLIAKRFVIVLNEDLVTYITDWTEHNKIRADRKIDSIYKNLLLQIVPDIALLEAKERADRKPMDGTGTSQGQPKDGIGKDRLGKDRLVKDSKKDLCHEQEHEVPAPEQKIAISFILNDGSMYDIAENDADKYRQLYPGIDVMQELRNIVAWCDANPKNRKTRSGARRFLNGWLARAQNGARKPAAGYTKPTNRQLDFDQRDTDYEALLREERRGTLDNGEK